MTHFVLGVCVGLLLGSLGMSVALREWRKSIDTLSAGWLAELKRAENLERTLTEMRRLAALDPAEDA